MYISHAVGLCARFSYLVVIVAEELFLSIEELVRLLLIDESKLVGIFRYRLDQTAEALLGILGSHVEVLVVLEKYAKVGVVLEGEMRCQPREKHLVHLHGFLEHCQVFALELLLHLAELLFRHCALAFGQTLEFFARGIKVRLWGRGRNLQITHLTLIIRELHDICPFNVNLQNQKALQYSQQSLRCRRIDRVAKRTLRAL